MLIVEPITLVSVVLAQHIRDLGGASIEVRNAEEAIDVLMANDAMAVVFAELDLPGPINGLGLVHWIGQHRPHIRIRVTSTSRRGQMPADYISKPYELGEVARELVGLLAD